MTDTSQTNEEQEQQGGNENANLRHLRERAEAATAAEARAEAAERRIAILESGIDVANPMAKFFVDHYDGDITDTAALVEQAKSMGIPFKGVTTEQVTQQQQGEGEQVQGQPATQLQNGQVLEPTGTEQRRALAGEGYDVGNGNDSPDPRQAALKESQEAIDKGATQDQAGGNFIARLAQAAGRGDSRVIIENTSERTKSGQPIQRWQ